MGYNHADIIKHAQFAIDSAKTSSEFFRIEVMNTMISIVRSLDAKVNDN